MYREKLGTDEFYLRMMLLRVRGVTSYTDLLTVEVQEYATFQEAATAAGLSEEGVINEKCFEEAELMDMTGQVRSIFGYILALGSQPNSTVQTIWCINTRGLCSTKAH
jgi:hypothetical protein